MSCLLSCDGRFDGIVTCLVSIATDDISNVNSSSNMPNYSFNCASGFVGSNIGRQSSEGGSTISVVFPLVGFGCRVGLVLYPGNMVGEHCIIDAVLVEGDGIWCGRYYAKWFVGFRQKIRAVLESETSSWYELFKKAIYKYV